MYIGQVNSSLPHTRYFVSRISYRELVASTATNRHSWARSEETLQLGVTEAQAGAGNVPCVDRAGGVLGSQPTQYR
jgi:hypothetical protein